MGLRNKPMILVETYILFIAPLLIGLAGVVIYWLGTHGFGGQGN